MAVADGKVFASVKKTVVVIESGKNEITNTIEFDGNVSGVIKASDGNLWVSDASGSITKVDAKTYAKVASSMVSAEAKVFYPDHTKRLPVLQQKAILYT